MTAWAFCNTYNEAALIAYWVRAYLLFCERVVVFVDIDSEDGTAEIAAREGADVRPYDGGGTGMDDQLFAAHASASYRECVGQTDWCIWTDADEILWHPKLGERLDQLKEAGVTLPHTDYYVMAAPGVPVHGGQIWDRAEFRRGLFVERNAKICVFDPNRLNVVWSVGKHSAVIDGLVRRDDCTDPLRVLHYRWLGEDYLVERNARNYARLSQRSKVQQLGWHVYPEHARFSPYDPSWSAPGIADTQDVFGLIAPDR